MDRHPIHTSLLAEHGRLSEQIRQFVLNDHCSEDYSAQSLRDRVSDLLHKANQNSVVFPEAALDAFRQSCNAMLAELQPPSVGLRAFASPETEEECQRHRQPSSSPQYPALEPTASEPASEPARRRTHVYAMLDLPSSFVFGFLVTPEPVSERRDQWRERLGPEVALLKLPTVEAAMYSLFMV
ncbi:hypothetical protein AURDEDRAFT_139602 [Auricularia subglabra TFB-10046 SS5]|nr:hypothetical protein AURDEDRAFT_139602 [Auricularia subglabra TFB-10046 SS5]